MSEKRLEINGMGEEKEKLISTMLTAKMTAEYTVE